MEEVLKDERFSHIFTDPRFRRIPKNVKKVKVDSRFKEFIKGKKFKKKCHVDERGRALNLESSENLKKLYNIDDDSNESADDETFDSNEKIENASSSKKSTKKCKDIKVKKRDKICQDTNKTLSKKKYMSNSDNSENDLSDQKSTTKMNIKKNVKEKSSRITNENKSRKTKSFNLNESSCEETELISENIKKNFKTEKKKQKSNNSASNKVNSKETDVINKLDSRFKQEDFDQEDVLNSSNEESVSSEEENSHANEDYSESDSSSDSDDTDSEDSANDEFDHQWEEHHERAPDTDEITRRLAVCHMDWDRIRAVDLYAVFNSFKPPDTSVLSVKIYPSEFGLKRMEEEKLNGPPELVEKTLASDEEEIEDKKGGKYHREKLRQYQMNRLKYYYAIVECDTPETANSLYEQLNGMEYESSSVRFDLRFVPDDMVFDQEPTSVSENIPDLTDYKPRLFVTTALQQVKVGLTWDETDPQRREVLQKAFTEPDSIEKDIKEYLASSSGESEDEIIDNEDGGVKLSTQERIQKYKALLESINEQEKKKNEEKYEMEITWNPEVKEKTENLVKEKLEEKTITPFEELQKKRKEKQKLKKKEKKVKNTKDEMADSMSDDSDSDESLDKEVKRNKERNDVKTTDELYLISDSKKIDENTTKASKKKMKKKLKQQKVEEDVKVDVNDPRFSSIFTSPLYNIDPSDPRFKKTPANLALIAEKQRRLKNKASSQGENSENKRMKYI